LQIEGSRRFADDRVHPTSQGLVDEVVLHVACNGNDPRLSPLEQRILKLSRLFYFLIDERSYFSGCSRSVLEGHVAVHENKIELIVGSSLLHAFDSLVAVEGDGYLFLEVNVADPEDNLNSFEVEHLIINNEDLRKETGFKLLFVAIKHGFVITGRLVAEVALPVDVPQLLELGHASCFVVNDLGLKLEHELLALLTTQSARRRAGVLSLRGHEHLVNVLEDFLLLQEYSLVLLLEGEAEVEF